MAHQVFFKFKMTTPNKSEQFDQYNLRDCSRPLAQRNTLLVKFSLLWLLIFFGSILSVWTVVLKKTLESPLNGKEIKPVNLKGNQPWIFTGRTDAETLILWPRDVKSQLTGIDPDAGKDWRQEEKGVTEDEMGGITNSRSSLRLTSIESVMPSSRLILCRPLLNIQGWFPLELTGLISL